MRSRIVYLLCTYLLLISSISCDSDEPVPEKLFTFTVSKSIVSSHWVVFSDPTGKVLQWHAMVNGETKSFAIPSSESITLTLISKQTPNFHLLQSFVDVEPGDYGFGFGDSNNGSSSGSLGAFSLNITNPEKYVNPFPLSEGSCNTTYIDLSRITLDVCDPNANLYMAVVKLTEYQAPRYVYREKINGNESLTLDDNLFAQLPLMKNQPALLDQPVSGFTIVTGETSKKKKLFPVSYYSSGFKLASIPVYYPDLLNTMFSSFTATLSYSYEDNVHHFFTKEFTTPPTAYPALNASFNFADSSSITTRDISFQAGGQADYIFTSFNYYNSDLSAWWYVYAPFASEISVHPPVFPDDLKSAIDLSYVSKLKKTQLSFIEDKGVGGYAGVYRKALSITPLDFTAGTTDRRTKVYTFQNGIVIGGRVAAPKIIWPE